MPELKFFDQIFSKYGQSSPKKAIIATKFETCDEKMKNTGKTIRI